jgi:hypothetical protein
VICCEQSRLQAWFGSREAATRIPSTGLAQRRWDLQFGPLRHHLMTRVRSPSFAMNICFKVVYHWTSWQTRQSSASFGTLLRAVVVACTPFTENVPSVTRVSGLQLLIFAQRVGVYDSDLKLLYRAFGRAPKTPSGNLTYDQVKHMLRDLNIRVTKRVLKPIFEEVCTPGDSQEPVCGLDAVMK